MIKIEMPSNNESERSYVLEVLFKEFLGLKYEAIKSDKFSDWRILLENGKSLIFEDHFFSTFPETRSYLTLHAIPDQVTWANTHLSPEGNVPVIYGNPRIVEQVDTIVCGIDIFASSFFMLTRWEEYVNKTRDNHERFPASESLAFKFGFLGRPVVNEYVELLWQMLKELGFDEPRRERSFSVLPTHDVDSTYYWTSWRFILKTLAGDILKRKSLRLFWGHLYKNLRILISIEKDPFDTFNELMSLSRSHNLKSYFFFMCGGNSRFDNAYDLNSSRTARLIRKISKAGHEIGIHPSYNTFRDPDRFEAEIRRLEGVSGRSVTFGRHHVLRYDVSSTPRIWDSQSMAWDSTLGYAEHNGFRAGVCYEFSMFDFLSGSKLTLKQKPLLFMEVTDFKYRKLSLEQSVENTLALLKRVQRYHGEFVFLWHNSNIDTDEWQKRFRALYLPIIASTA
jgi:peptidoglycan/xylan/chitin deacetylase (PgdA/CDA1 family)